jgi:Fe-S cluster assembly scaffold protein SufB
MGGLEVEHNNIGEMLAMLVLSSEDEKFAALPEACGVPHSYARNIPVVVDQIPLSCDEVQTKHVVVYFVSVLVEASKGVYLIIANICHRRIDEASGLGANCRNHFRFVAFYG